MKTRTKISLARKAFLACMLMRKLMGQGTIATVNRGGLNWQLDLKEGIDFAIYLLGMFERETVNAYRQLNLNGCTVLDIGANIGAHTLHLGKAVGESGRVYAFEPTRYCFDKLLKNISLNPELASQIIPHRTLLVDETNSIHSDEIYSSWPLISSDEGHPEHCGQLKDASNAVVVRLDDFIQSEEIDSVDLIKLDVDGNESKVLRGAEACLGRFRPKIIMELATSYHDDDSPDSAKELLRILSASGYDLHNLDTGNRLPIQIDAINKLIPAGSSMNVMALPSE